MNPPPSLFRASFSLYPRLWVSLRRSGAVLFGPTQSIQQGQPQQSRRTDMASQARKLAVVTGASSGIGYELARIAAGEGYDLLIAADEERINTVADELRASGARVEGVFADLATSEGVRMLVERVNSNSASLELLLANAGHGLGHAFLDQEFAKARHVIDTTVTGTVELIHALGNVMRRQRAGRILITGSIAGFMPGAFQAAYNGSKAFLNSFAFALRN